MTTMSRFGGAKLTIVAVILGMVFLVAIFTYQGKVQLRQIQPALDSIANLKAELTQNWKSSADQIAYNDNTPLGSLRRNGMIKLPEKAALQDMRIEQMINTYHSYLDNVDVICNRKLRMGKMGDGGWEICDDPQYRPSRPCIIYSFGINNDFSFDDDAAKVYNCSVFSFDPSMKANSYQRSPLVTFLKMGISSNNERSRKGWELRTLASFKTQLKHTEKVIDVLKMDVENAEWSSLPQMVQSGDLHKVKQLLMEYHGQHLDKTSLVPHLNLLKDLYDIGFRKFYVHKNPACSFKTQYFPMAKTACYEVHYVNINTPV